MDPMPAPPGATEMYFGGLGGEHGSKVQQEAVGLPHMQPRAKGQRDPPWGSAAGQKLGCRQAPRKLQAIKKARKCPAKSTSKGQ